MIPDSVKLSGALAETERSGTPLFSIDDLNDDGILDLLVNFRAQNLQLTETHKLVVLKRQTLRRLTHQGRSRGAHHKLGQ